MAKKLINLAKIDFSGNSGSAPVPPGPGPTPAPSADADVVLRDYDGSVVATYTKEEFAALTELPAPPEHEGLTFQEWNWPLADAQAYCAQYGMVDIGATYITSDGKTRIYITLTEGRTSPKFGLGVNGSVDIDWGDGSVHSTLTGGSISTLISTTHNYSTPGSYIIALTPAEGAAIAILGDSNGSSLVRADGFVRYAYQNSVKAVHIGNRVSSIGNYAFSYCYSLTSIVIPNSVTSMGSNICQYCYSLNSVVIPHSVISLGNSAFQYCYNLSSIVIPNSVTSIGNGTFGACYSLVSIIIPNSVTSLGNSAFQYCYNASSIIIPNSVTRIGDSALQYCYSISSIIISNSVTSLNRSVFSYCYSLTNIIIPNSVTSINFDVFGNNYGMKYYYFYATNPATLQVNSLYNIPDDAIIYVPAESVEAYKTATNWSSYASKILPMP